MRGRDRQILPTQSHKSTNVNVAPFLEVPSKTALIFLTRGGSGRAGNLASPPAAVPRQAP